MEFWKYHGLGNDFALIDRRRDGDLSPDAVRAICDRHTGVGADGVIVWRDDPSGAPRMRVFNADGSTADMCGNGLRCFVRWLIDDMGVVPSGDALVVATDAGPQTCLPRGVDVTVDLGPPTLRGPLVAEVGDERFEGHDLFLGNPHFVIPRGPAPGEAERVGYALSTHARFPRGTNVEWLAVEDRRTARVVVWERGCGLTRACGTGGGGAAVTGVRLGLLDADTQLTLRLPGGDLIYTVAADFGAVWMTGPAEKAFTGRWARAS